MLTHARVVDLSQPLSPATVLWPDSTAVEFPVMYTHEADGSFARDIRTPEHAGTHFDAPAHYDPKGATVEAIPADLLVRPVAVLHAADLVGDDESFALTAAHVERFEQVDGPIERGSAVLLQTGWERHRGDAALYLGGEREGELNFPGYGLDAAQLLVGERGVVGLGIDTVSIDRGVEADYPVHYYTLPSGIWHLEGLINLGELPPRGAWVFVGALPLEGASGTPSRVIAVVP